VNDHRKPADHAAGEPGVPTFKAVERHSIAMDAIEQLKGLVASGALRPGERLPPERTLSDLLGVSRPTVREAVNALAAMGILDKRQGSGTYVTALDSALLAQPFVFMLDANPKALYDLFDVRLALETHAAGAAAQRIDQIGLARLKQVLEVLRSECNGDIEAFVAADLHFHRLVHEASGNAILLQLMASLNTLGKQSRMLTAQDRQTRAATVREHDVILDRLEERDADGAAEAMRRHLGHVRSELRSATVEEGIHAVGAG